MITRSKSDDIASIPMQEESNLSLTEEGIRRII